METDSAPSTAVREELERQLTAPEASTPEAPEWVQAVGRDASEQQRPGEWPIVPATLADTDYAVPTLEPVRRLVYRVSFLVPPVFRQRREHLQAHPGELHLDVAVGRLRARFEGPGWPVHEGSEVRIREDTPGVYLFDGHGGRWLPPGAMAAWFEGRQGRATSRIRVRRDYKPIPSEGPGALVCALLSEWTNQSRDSLQGRCRGNVIPPGFRFGPWSADLTAILPMDLPRQDLRADGANPPDRPTNETARVLIARPELERLSPQWPLTAEQAAATAGAAPDLVVHNRTGTRVIVMVQGLPVATIDSGASTTVEGLAAGQYRIGATRPFGVLLMPPKLLPVPGELTIER